MKSRAGRTSGCVSTIMRRATAHVASGTPCSLDTALRALRSCSFSAQRRARTSASHSAAVNGWLQASADDMAASERARAPNGVAGDIRLSDVQPWRKAHGLCTATALAPAHRLCNTAALAEGTRALHRSRPACTAVVGDQCSKQRSPPPFRAAGRATPAPRSPVPRPAAVKSSTAAATLALAVVARALRLLSSAGGHTDSAKLPPCRSAHGGSLPACSALPRAVRMPGNALTGMTPRSNPNQQPKQQDHMPCGTRAPATIQLHPRCVTSSPRNRNSIATKRAQRQPLILCARPRAGTGTQRADTESATCL